MAQHRSTRGGAWSLRELTRGGRLEVVLAALLAGLAVTLEIVNQQPWQVIALDLSACGAAALTFRWPRVAGIALGILLAVYIVVPAAWATMGEYAPLIPILGTGMRGANRARLAMTVGYWPLLSAITWPDAPSASLAIAGAAVWGILIGVLWLIGNAFQAMLRAQQRARGADLVLQRQALAGELHDTVARSLTRVIMTAEQAALRGEASPADLESITEAAQMSMRELRLVMNLLAVPDPSLPISVQHTPLGDAIDTGVAQLEQHGFGVSQVIRGELATVPAEDAVVLGTAAQEAIANIIKHADTEAGCAIIVDITGPTAELAFVNGYADAEEPGQGLGLWGMRERLQRAGGEVLVQHTSRQWITTVRLPLSAAARPREGS